MPNKTLEYFKEITNIPRPSGSEEKIVEYLSSFCKKHKLDFYTDENRNVIIKKPTNCGNNKTLILQGHTDMVCEKNGDVNIDFFKEGLKTKIEDNFMMAQGTTLGADNGIGVATFLSILTDNDVAHPNLEVVLTAEEETTMKGAHTLDYGKINGLHLLSLDGTDEGKIEVSSAGFVTLECQTEAKNERLHFPAYKISITGLLGGHSGSQINTTRKNAIKLLFEGLNSLNNFSLCDISCDSKKNVIPREASAVVSFEDNTTAEKIKHLFELNLKKYRTDEPNLLITVQQFNVMYKLGIDSQNNILSFVNQFKNGVLVFDKKDKNFPLTSNNIANIKVDNDKILFTISLRSSVEKYEKKFVNKIVSLGKQFNIIINEVEHNPFFEKKENSYLQKLCVDCYKSVTGDDAIIEGVHAGLEGGVFAKNIPNIDICTIAPNIYDAHSPMERVSLPSVNRVYEWVKEILKNF